MTDVRANLTEYLAPLRAKGLSLRELSRRLGRNDSYLQQYLSGKKSPRRLAHEDKLALHALIGIPLEQLGLTAAAAGRNGAAAAPVGGANDVEPYESGRGGADVILPRTGRLYRVLRDVLGRHPLGLKVGDVVVVVSDEESLHDLRSEQIVLVAVDADETLPARLLLREFVRPALAITNRAGSNESLSLDGGAGAPTARVVGVVRSLLRLG